MYHLWTPKLTMNYLSHFSSETLFLQIVNEPKFTMEQYDYMKRKLDGNYTLSLDCSFGHIIGIRRFDGKPMSQSMMDALRHTLESGCTRSMKSISLKHVFYLGN